MIVVSNTTPLVAMAMTERFDLLRRIFGHIHIPQALYQEVVEEGRDRFGAREVAEATWIHVAEAQDGLAVAELEDQLDRGESEAIVLAQEMGASWVLVDERLARRKLESLGIRTIGSLGILLKAKEAGLIEAVQPEIKKLRERGFRLSRRVYDEVLQSAGEA